MSSIPIPPVTLFFFAVYLVLVTPRRASSWVRFPVRSSHIFCCCFLPSWQPREGKLAKIRRLLASCGVNIVVPKPCFVVVRVSPCGYFWTALDHKSAFFTPLFSGRSFIFFGVALGPAPTQLAIFCRMRSLLSRTLSRFPRWRKATTTTATSKYVFWPCFEPLNLCQLGRWFHEFRHRGAVAHAR